MNSFKLLFGLIGILVLLSAVEGLTQNSTKQKKESSEKSKPSASPTTSPSPTLSPTPSAKIDNPIFYPTPAPNTSSKDSSFIYPGSTVISSSANSYELQTNDDSDAVTSWYKDKINSQSFGARSTVKTKTNGNVLNKISASGSTKIEIEIKKEKNSPTTYISIRF